MIRRALDILLVEGEEPLARAMADALRARGHHVRTAANSALALAYDADLDVLVSDLQLDGIDGLELLAELQRRGARPRAVLVTSFATVEDCRRAMRLGAVDMLVKPFKLEELVVAAEADRGTDPRPRARRRYLATEEEVLRAALDVSAHALRCHVGPASRARIATACAEVLDNVVHHAYPVDPGPVDVAVHVDERRFVVEVVDEGIGFEPLDVGLDRLERSLDGGLARAMALSEALRVDTRPGAGARVRLVFEVARTHFDEAEGRLDLSDLDFLPPETARRIVETLDTCADGDLFHLSPAIAVTVGRLLVGPDVRRSLRTVLRS